MEQTIADAFKELKENLKFVYEENEVEIILGWVFEHVFNYSKVQGSLNAQTLVNAEQAALLHRFETELTAHRPIQYVLGESYFYGLKLKVDESVLIPRPETEELVDWCLKEIKRPLNQDFKILDIGTGSGCIALAIKSKLKNAEVWAVDISEKALKIAQENAQHARLEIALRQTNILDVSNWSTLPDFDVIISNPPYITKAEQKEMSPNVLKYEPENALFVQNDDPLQFYKSIADFAKLHLKKDGKLFFELNALFAEETKNWLLGDHWEVELKNDLQGRARMIQSKRVIV